MHPPQTKIQTSELPDEEETDDTFRSLKSNKGSGEDVIVAELWKKAGSYVIQEL